MQLSKTGPWSRSQRSSGRRPPVARRSTRAIERAALDVATRIAMRSNGRSALRIGELTSWWTRVRDGPSRPGSADSLW